MWAPTQSLAPPMQVFAIRYMVFSRRSLSHPRANFGRGVMAATSLFSALHITNIATLYLSFTPAMNTWVGQYHASFNRVLLTATWVFGYLAAAIQLLFMVMLLRCAARLLCSLIVCGVLRESGRWMGVHWCDTSQGVPNLQTNM